jgi:hypothetical protein
MRCVLIVTACLALWGCSKGGGLPAKQPDGSYHLACQGALVDCLQRAERLCHDEGYTVTEARDVREMLGHESGESQVEIRKSEATIYCGKSAPPGERRMIELKRETPVSATPKAPAPAKPAPLACVPGTTQSCVGPGGCAGGQACAADGARYEACDCGGATSPPAGSAN